MANGFTPRENGSPNEVNDKYVEAYGRYISAHSKGNIRFSRNNSPSAVVFFTGKQTASAEEIFQKAMKFQTPGSEQLVSNAKGNYTDEITNTFRDI